MQVYSTSIPTLICSVCKKEVEFGPNDYYGYWNRTETCSKECERKSIKWGEAKRKIDSFFSFLTEGQYSLLVLIASLQNDLYKEAIIERLKVGYKK